MERDSEYSGLTYEILDMSPAQLHHGQRALQGLKRVELKLNAKANHSHSSDEATPWSIVLRRGLLAEALAAAHQLEERSILLDKPDVTNNGMTTHIPDLEKLVGTNTWAALRCVTLGYMAVKLDSLLKFLNRHARTLRKIRMIQMEILANDELATEPFSEEKWAQTYGSEGRNKVAAVVMSIE